MYPCDAIIHRIKRDIKIKGIDHLSRAAAEISVESHLHPDLRDQLMSHSTQWHWLIILSIFSTYVASTNLIDTITRLKRTNVSCSYFFPLNLCLISHELATVFTPQSADIEIRCCLLPATGVWWSIQISSSSPKLQPKTLLSKTLSPKLFKVNEIYRMKVKFLFTNVCGVLKQSKPQIFRLAGKHIVGSGRNWMGLDSFIPSRCLVFITQRGSWSTYRFLFIHLFEQRGIYQDHWSLLSGWLMLHFLDIAKEKEPFW